MSTEVQTIQLIKLHIAPAPIPLMGILDIVDSTTGRRIRCSSRLPQHHGQYHVRHLHSIYAEVQDVRPFLSVRYEFFNGGNHA